MRSSKKNRHCEKANKMINQRDDDNIFLGRKKGFMDVERIMLERRLSDESVDGDSESEESYDGDEQSMFGEITGEKVKSESKLGRGMPLRSAFKPKNEKYDINSHLDFNLNKQLDRNEMNRVEYNDTYSGEYAGLDEAMRTITRNVDSLEKTIDDINYLTIWLYRNMTDVTKSDLVVSGFSMFGIFSGLYLLENGKMKDELAEYFGFVDKNKLGPAFEKINSFLQQDNQFIFSNYLIADSHILVSDEYPREYDVFFGTIHVRKSKMENEIGKINEIIEKFSLMKNLISGNTLKKMDIGLIMTCRIEPIWGYPIDDIVTTRFRKREARFLRFVGRTFNYYEDTEHRILEIPLHGGSIAMGLIIPKHGKIPPIEWEKINNSINFLKPVVIEELLFPQIKKRYRTRYKGMLKKTGMDSIFVKGIRNEVFPEGGYVNDCIQYIDIVFGTKCTGKKNPGKGYSTTNKFIVNDDFEFYFRHTKKNIIPILGRI
jgi:serine protease inhibitor